jgi:nucleotide-binding universal stress UspA family protein
MRYGSIVVGTDGSSGATATVRRGAELAREWGATLHIVSAYKEPTRHQREAAARKVPTGLHVENAGDGRQIARAIVEDSAEMLRDFGVRVVIHVVKADPAEALIDVARRKGLALILVGNRGVRSPLRKLRPPIFERVRRGAPCDVEVLDTEAYRRVA